ncbi:MAG: YggT family protein [Campylobacteraceae bacterium]|jgi:YggT family protein|nr:YggT family protein [Campylobacteraceae bacterium]
MNVFLIALFQTLKMIVDIYLFIVVISSLISWVQPNPYNPVVQFLNKITIPVYNIIRRAIPTTFGMIDIAPLIVCIILIFLSKLITNLIYAL